MHKIYAISLVVLWFLYLFFRDYEYGWILGILLSLYISYAFAYFWTYDDFKKEIEENICK